MARLRREHRRLQDRIDAMYVDKLDGAIAPEFYERKLLDCVIAGCVWKDGELTPQWRPGFGGKERVEEVARNKAAMGPTDSPAKPLTKRYAIWKTKHRRGNRRNLTFTGSMLRNFMVRTVSERRAVASNTTRKDRIKARVNEQIEPWMMFSPKNRGLWPRRRGEAEEVGCAEVAGGKAELSLRT